MAKFDWIAFLHRHRVPYNTQGPNTPRGTVTVHCPFCGPADPSDHMVIWQKAWRCWRDHSHGGKHPAKLVQALIRCTSLEAQRITAEASVATAGELASIADMFKPAVTTVRTLKLPPEFRPFKNEWACQPFIDYLRQRGFKGNSSYLHWRYGLHYCRQGPFKGRIIFPVVHGGRLVSWTGRTIYPVEVEEVRYKSLTTDSEIATKVGLEAALAPINHHFLWYDWLTDKTAMREAHTFALVEGPLDTLKINVLGEPVIVSTCWMGSEPTAQQIELLHTLARPFTRRIVISDSDMPQKAERIAAKLCSLNFKAVRLPAGVEDPAEIQSFKQLSHILS